MIIQLSEEYIPEYILHREVQCKKIKSIFQNFKNSGMGTNLSITGVTGSGKTTLIRKILEDQNDSIYINCNETKTPFKTLSKICHKKVKTQSDVLQIVIEELKANPKILILDEIDKTTNLFLLANDLNTIYRKVMVPIIIISPKRNIVEKMPTDVRKTLFFNKLNLPSYNALELRDILDQRIKSMTIDLSKLDEAKKSFICAVASKQGSARVLINILIRCIQENNFTQVYISGIYEDMVKKDWLGFIEDINETEKKFLQVLLDLCDDKKLVDFQILQKEMKLSGGRISQLINTFERYDAIRSDVENLGRGGGRRRRVKFIDNDTYNLLKTEAEL